MMFSVSSTIPLLLALHVVSTNSFVISVYSLGNGSLDTPSWRCSRASKARSTDDDTHLSGEGFDIALVTAFKKESKWRSYQLSSA